MRSGYFKVDYRSDRELLPFFFDKLSVGVSVAVLLAVPWTVSAYWLHVANLAGIAVLGAVGLNLLMGYTGQISLGHGAFLAVGAYTAAVLLGALPRLPFPVVLVAAGLVSGAVGLLAAVPAFRLKGLYLALSSLALQHVVALVLVKWTSLTNGAVGLHVAKPRFFGVEVASPRAFYFLVLAVAAAGIAAAANLLRGKSGRAFMAIRDWDLAAAAMGVSVARYKTLSFVVSSFYAGVGGALYAYYIGFISPEDFTLLVSVNYIAMVIVGGTGSLAGSVLGAVFITALPEAASALSHGLRGVLPSADSAAVRPYLEMTCFGVVIVAFLLFEPDGLFGRWKTIRNYFVMWPFRF